MSFAGGGLVSERLVDGLWRMEYRSYDSGGICSSHKGALVRRRAEGRLTNLARPRAGQPGPGVVGIARTRWATHGAPTAGQCSPPCDQRDRHRPRLHYQEFLGVA